MPASYAIVTVCGPFAWEFLYRDSAEEAMTLYQAAHPDVLFWVEEYSLSESSESR